MTALAVTTVGTGPAVALVPGWGFAAAALHPLAERLATRRTVHLVDLPGHGASRALTMADDLAGLAAQLDATLPGVRDWVGWSLGGLACLQLGLHREGRLRRLALLAATPRFTAGPGWPAALPAAELEAFKEALAVDPDATLVRFAGLVARGDANRRAVLRALRAALDRAPTPDPRALATGLELLGRGDLRASARRLATPTLWLLGAADALIPAALAGEFAHWDHAHGTLLPATGHAPFLSAGTACAERLEAFLDA